MNTINDSIFNSCINISKNIELLKNNSDIGFLSQNILSQLRTLVESVALKLHNDEKETQLTYNDIKRALNYIKRKPEYKFLDNFHQMLAITKSHYISDDENSTRLLIIYSEYLIKVKLLLNNKYKIDVLENINNLCFKIDDKLKLVRGDFVTYEIFLKDIGQNIKQRRKKLGLTQKELADKTTLSLEISDKQISRLECGENTMRLDKLLDVMRVLGKTPDYFFLGIDNSDEAIDNNINKISEYLKLCSLEDIERVLVIVKALSENNKK